MGSVRVSGQHITQKFKGFFLGLRPCRVSDEDRFFDLLLVGGDAFECGEGFHVRNLNIANITQDRVRGAAHHLISIVPPVAKGGKNFLKSLK